MYVLNRQSASLGCDDLSLNVCSQTRTIYLPNYTIFSLRNLSLIWPSNSTSLLIWPSKRNYPMFSLRNAKFVVIFCFQLLRMAVTSSLSFYLSSDRSKRSHYSIAPPRVNREYLRSMYPSSGHTHILTTNYDSSNKKNAKLRFFIIALANSIAHDFSSSFLRFIQLTECELPKSNDFLVYNFLDEAIMSSDGFLLSFLALFTLLVNVGEGQSYSLDALGVSRKTLYFLLAQVSNVLLVEWSRSNSAGVLVVCLIRKVPIFLREGIGLPWLLGLSTFSVGSSAPKFCK